MMEILLDETDSFNCWTSIRRASLTEWIGNNNKYAITDIISLRDQMQYNLFEKIESIALTQTLTHTLKRK